MTAPPEPAGSLDIETFAQNLARAIEQGGKALAAYMKPREEGRVDGEGEYAEFQDFVKTLSQVSECWLMDPQRATNLQVGLGQSYLDLWASSAKRLTGETTPPVIEPEPRDKRFTDAEWSSNQFFDFLKQAYLLTAKWGNRLVTEAEGLDPETRQKAAFYIRQIANAIAPSNFVLTNPELLRETLSSNAANLVRGMHMLAEDIEAGGGNLRIRQTDDSNFEVGRNLATTPGKVIFENDLMQLIQYAPSTPTVFKRPLLIVPPWINKFYVLDLTPEKSFVKWCVDQGLTVFMISWVNPDGHLADKTFENYVQEGPLAALDAIEKATGEKKVNAVGYCVGGTLLAVTLASMAGRRDRRIASATFFASQVDFTYSGELKVFADEHQIEAIERQMAAHGYLDSQKMANSFNLMRSNDLIWPYVINNYFKGKEPLPFDLLYWNADSTRMPAANHSFYLRNCYLENNLARGKMIIAGKKLNLKSVTIPIYNLATREDHIAPAKSCLVGTPFFGGPAKFVVAGSGHIAGVVNPPQKAKYQYWTGGEMAGADIDHWLASATEHPGSWWPDWLNWLKSHYERKVKARKPGGGKLKAIEAAPGRYVKVRD